MADQRTPILPVADPDYIPIPDDSTGPSWFSTQNRSKKLLLFSLSCGLVLVWVMLGTGSDHSINIPHTPSTTTKTTSRGKFEGVSEKSNGQQRLFRDYDWENKTLSWQRTAFHFQPEKNWMNDPNGPLYYKGWYHFFYQYNPFSAVWGDIAWGHAVSKDLIRWVHLPLAMVADQWYDVDGVWTGSATILSDGKIVMLYTGSTNDSVQVQCLAYPANHDDPLLLDWVKYSGNPVLVPPPGIGSKDFRDPTTAWMTSEGKWRITVGSKIHRTGIALVYDTEDFIHYEQKNVALHGVPGTGMWECVDFYPVSMTGPNGLDTSANGPDVKHVLKASLDDDRHDYYALGSYDDATGQWIPDNAEIDVGIGIRYDYGVFYASKTFYDQSKQRRVLWGWVGESDSESSDVKKGWACLQGFPRTVSMDIKTKTNLIQWPVEEIESLRLGKQEFNEVELNPGSVVQLDVEDASQLDIVAEFELDKETLNSSTAEFYPDEGAEFRCADSKGAAHRGALGPFGLLVLTEETLTEQTPVYFYLTKGRNETLTTFFCTDQSRSSLATDVSKLIHGSYVPTLEGEKISVRILVDHSIVESFAQGGRSVITSRVYPTMAIYGNAKLFLFNNATEASVKASVQVWQMGSAYEPISDSVRTGPRLGFVVFFSMLYYLVVKLY
ncbi:Acid beta-fructofuranosidase 2, vacuolar [Linum grandiflorum]